MLQLRKVVNWQCQIDLEMPINCQFPLKKISRLISKCIITSLLLSLSLIMRRMIRISLMAKMSLLNTQMMRVRIRSQKLWLMRIKAGNKLLLVKKCSRNHCYLVLSRLIVILMRLRVLFQNNRD